jgi:hypothetical protein
MLIPSLSEEISPIMCITSKIEKKKKRRRKRSRDMMQLLLTSI